MQDTELYQQVLGLESPWKVSNVDLNMELGEVVVSVSHPKGIPFCCPECNRELSCYDHSPARRWRHLDSCQFKTMLEAAVPRVKCPEHGVKQVSVPWSSPSSRFTLMFEAFAISLLKATQTVEGARRILRIGWEATWGILERAVERGQARKQSAPLPHIGIDEKSFRKGQDYITLIYDLDNSTVEAISEGHNEEAANECFSQLLPGQIETVEAIAMDMSAAFVKSAKSNIPLAEEKIVHDRFHVMKLANEAVDKIRKEENKRLRTRETRRSRVPVICFSRITTISRSPGGSNSIRFLLRSWRQVRLGLTKKCSGIFGIMIQPVKRRSFSTGGTER